MTTTQPSPVLPPAIAQLGAIAWIRKNLFGSWFDTILTLIVGFILGKTLISFITWSTSMAKWAVIPANLPLFFVGRFPADQYWRMWALVWMIAILSGLTWGILARNTPQLFTKATLIWVAVAAVVLVLVPTPLPYKLLLLATEAWILGSAWVGRIVGRQIPKSGQWIAFAWSLSFFVALWLMLGGLGLPMTPTNVWGGLLLTLFMSLVSIILCFPIGVLLALGRQSSLPIIRWLSTVYIEVVRGVPLISLLFVGAVMIPLFLPGNVRPDLVLRAIVGLTMFSAAYLAENVRGGLQSIPKGQGEAASALGLNTPLSLALIVMPQALKVSIPAIVGQFISLVQDTTLVSIVGLFDLLGISRSTLSNPLFVGRYAEVYLFIGLIYWIFCYAMSWGSRKLEEQLNTTR